MSLRVTGLTCGYGGVPVLHEVSFAVRSGEVLAVVGPNGSGKTTLLKALSGALGAGEERGRVFLGGESLSDLGPRAIARRLAVVEAEVLPYFDFTVEEIVELGRIPHLNRLEALGARDRAAVDRALSLTATAALSERPLSSLSSGERQRVWLALALAQEAEVLLLDEPTAHLDLKYQIEILDLVRSLAEDGLTVIFTVHDLNLAALYADRVALLSRGRIVTIGPPGAALTAERLASVYETDVRVLRDERTGEIEAILPGNRIRPG